MYHHRAYGICQLQNVTYHSIVLLVTTTVLVTFTYVSYKVSTFTAVHLLPRSLYFPSRGQKPSSASFLGSDHPLDQGAGGAVDISHPGVRSALTTYAMGVVANWLLYKCDIILHIYIYYIICIERERERIMIIKYIVYTVYIYTYTYIYICHLDAVLNHN